MDPVIYFHPQRGAFETTRSFNPRHRHYRGGRDSDWRVVSEPLPKGFLRGDPSKQRYGLGGPETVYGPLDRVCRDCKKPFLFTAAEQKYWYETLRFPLDSIAVRCAECRKILRRREKAREDYAAALQAAKKSTTAATCRAVAAAAIALIDAGGHAPIAKALGFARKAVRLGANADALVTRLEQKAKR